MQSLHSSNTVLKLDVKGTVHLLPETLLYFERNNYSLYGFFEIGVNMFAGGSNQNVMKKMIEDVDPVKVEVITSNAAKRIEINPFDYDIIGVIESLGICYIYKQEFIVPSHGSLMCRYYFSNKISDRHDWSIDSKKLDDMHYKDNRVYDYAVKDAITELTEVIENAVYKKNFRSDKKW